VIETDTVNRSGDRKEWCSYWFVGFPPNKWRIGYRKRTFWVIIGC